MPDDRFTAPTPHQRTLPHVPVNEQGLRELEIWLVARLRKLINQQRNVTGEGWRFNIVNEGGWGYVIAGDSTDIDFGILGMVLGDKTAQGTFVFSRDDPQTKIASMLLTPDQIAVGMSTSLSFVIDRATDTFTLYDSLGGLLLQMTDGSSDLHLPTGGSIIFDL